MTLLIYLSLTVFCHIFPLNRFILVMGPLIIFFPYVFAFSLISIYYLKMKNGGLSATSV